MSPSPPRTAKRLGLLFLKGIGILAINIGLLFVIAKIFPLPKGQGFQYVAHPLWAIIFGIVSAVGFVLIAFFTNNNERNVFIGAIAGSGLISLFIFTLLA